MQADLALLTVNSVIIHEVPYRRSSTAAVLSEIESPMDDEIRQLLKERVIATIGDPSKAFEIDLDPNTTSPVPGLIGGHLANPAADSLVENSQAMAQHLFTTQPTTSPGGLLLVIHGFIAGKPAIIILKLEKEEGARIVPRPTGSGKRTFDIKHYKDLILTPKTKVFKIALFTLLGEGIEAVACDNQRPYTAHKALADYFLQQFLGCRLAVSATVKTKEFFDQSNDFFRRHYKDNPKRYANVYLQLVGELQSNKNTISPRRFATDHLPVADQKAYLSFLEQNGIKQTSFDKDNEFLDKELTRVMYGFASGTKLILPSQEAEDRVKLTNQSNGEVTVEFTDRLTDMKGR
jgi:hypothetical protein